MATIAPLEKPTFLRGVDDDDSIDNIGSSLRKNIKKNLSLYAQQRKDLKEKVIRESINMVLPDMEMFSIDQHLNEKPVVKVNNGFIPRWLKLCGCMKVTPIKHMTI